MAGFKLPKPAAAKGAAKFLKMGRLLSTQSPTDVFSKKRKRKTLTPGGKRPR